LIAAEARVTKITIYQHFENKEALFSAALHGFFEELPASSTPFARLLRSGDGESPQ